MNAVDVTGWFAAGLTMLTFFCRDMRRLRFLALCANGAFIAYGSMAALTPVLVLHLLLAPVNSWRLLEIRARTNADRADAAPSTALPTPFAKLQARRAVEPARRSASRQLTTCTSTRHRKMGGSATIASKSLHAGRVGMRIGGCGRRGTSRRRRAERVGAALA